MKQRIHTKSLEGPAASFKGGRSYVHASDLIPALDAMVASLSVAAVLTKIELHTPLRTRGIVHIETGLELPSKIELSATGEITDGPGQFHPFVVFPSPLPISSTSRNFEEEEIWPDCDIDYDEARVFAHLQSQLSVLEAASSMMKLLCKTFLPHQERWWFVRMTKSTILPLEVDWMSLQVQRIIAERLVQADVIGSKGHIGQIDFMGGKK